MGLDNLTMQQFVRDNFYMGQVGRPIRRTNDNNNLPEEQISVESILAMSSLWTFEYAHKNVDALKYPSFLDKGYGKKSNSLKDLIAYLKKPVLKNKEQWQQFRNDILGFWEDLLTMDSPQYLFFPEDIEKANIVKFQYLSRLTENSSELFYAFNNNRSSLLINIEKEILDREVQERHNLYDIELLHLIALSRVPGITDEHLIPLFEGIGNKIKPRPDYGHFQVYDTAKHMFGKV